MSSRYTFGLMLAVCTVGCSNGVERSKVAGKVYLGDQPLTAGQVSFVGPQVTSTSKIESDGSYAVPDAQVGEVKIIVTPANALLATAPPPPKGVEAIGAEETTGSTAAPPKNAKLPPDKYRKVESTDLTFTVASGDNAHDIKLAPGPTSAPSSGTRPPTVGMPKGGKPGGGVPLPK